MALDERKGVWKSGKGKGRHTPKGRQLDDTAWDEVRALLGDRPRRADLLIEQSGDDIIQRVHLVDRDTARLFYEVEEYYVAFERELDRRMKAAFARLNDLEEESR